MLAGNAFANGGKISVHSHVKDLVPLDKDGEIKFKNKLSTKHTCF